MNLVGTILGLWPPFSAGAAVSDTGPYYVVVADAFCAGAVAGDVFTPGAVAGDAFCAGVKVGQMAGA